MRGINRASGVSEGLAWPRARTEEVRAPVEQPRRPRQRKHGLLNRAQLFAYKIVFAHAGKFDIVALYFICTQWLHGQLINFRLFSQHIRFHLWNVKLHWDHLLSADWPHHGLVALMSQSTWTPMRHTIFRALVEGVVGAVLYNQIGFNVEKYKEKVKQRRGRVRWYNKVFASAYQDHPVTGLQYAFLPVLLLLVTIVLGVPLWLGLHFGLAQASGWTWLEPHLRTQSLVQKLYVGDYDALILGVFVGFVASRTYRPYLYANTMNYGRKWVAKGRAPKWWMPRPTRELIEDLCEEGVPRQAEILAQRSGAAVKVAASVFVIGFMLAVYGFYITKWVA